MKVWKLPPRQTKDMYLGVGCKPTAKKKRTTKKIVDRKRVVKELLEENKLAKEEKIPSSKYLPKIEKEYSDDELVVMVKRPSRYLARVLKTNTKKCEECGGLDYLEVHHKDKNPLNNDLNNLIKLCVFCHYGYHKNDEVGKLMLKRIKWIKEKGT